MLALTGRSRMSASSTLERDEKRLLRAIILVLILMLATGPASSAPQDAIVLTSKSAGPMPLEPGMPISIKRISEYFPSHTVTSEIRSGDSPDYYRFTIATCDGEPLISLICYIQDESADGDAPIGLAEVVLHSPKTIDEFGISPGSSISEAIAARGELIFGAGHMDSCLGRDQIWYLFGVNGMHGTQVSEERAVEFNAEIDVISWPIPRWR